MPIRLRFFSSVETLGVFLPLFESITPGVLLGLRATFFLFVLGFQIDGFVHDWDNARYISFLTIWTFVLLNLWLGVACTVSALLVRAGAISLTQKGESIDTVGRSEHARLAKLRADIGAAIPPPGAARAGASDGLDGAAGIAIDVDAGKKRAPWGTGPLSLKICAVLHVVVTVACPVIAVLYWTRVYEGGAPVSARTVVTHGINAVISTFDFAISAGAAPCGGALPWVLVYAAVYLIFSIIMGAAGEPPMYDALDWTDNVGGAVFTSVTALIGVALVFSIVWAYGRWKMARAGRKFAEAPDAGEAVPIVAPRIIGHGPAGGAIALAPVLPSSPSAEGRGGARADPRVGSPSDDGAAATSVSADDARAAPILFSEAPGSADAMPARSRKVKNRDARGPAKSKKRARRERKAKGQAPLPPSSASFASSSSFSTSSSSLSTTSSSYSASSPSSSSSSPSSSSSS